MASEGQTIALSRGGNTSKIHLAVDSYDLPIEFIITWGHIYDSTAANDLIEVLPFADYLVSAKGYDSEKVRDKAREQGTTPVIPRRYNSKAGNADIDWCLYKYSHLVENAFARLKYFLSIATRYDKLKIHFESMLSLAYVMVWLPM